MAENSSGRGRAIGLDVGTKTIGIAVSDPMGWFAQPVKTLGRRGVAKDVAAMAPICREKGVKTIVVGLPLELDGSETRSARLARQIGDAMGAALGLPVVYIDERYTSVEAERSLIEANLSRARRKEVIDQAAAALILQSWLDHGDWSQSG
jgi:putative Holliday junction resolvase